MPSPATTGTAPLRKMLVSGSQVLATAPDGWWKAEDAVPYASRTTDAQTFPAVSGATSLGNFSAYSTALGEMSLMPTAGQNGVMAVQFSQWTAYPSSLSIADWHWLSTGNPLTIVHIVAGNDAVTGRFFGQPTTGGSTNGLQWYQTVGSSLWYPGVVQRLTDGSSVTVGTVGAPMFTVTGTPAVYNVFTLSSTGGNPAATRVLTVAGRGSDGQTFSTSVTQSSKTYPSSFAPLTTCSLGAARSSSQIFAGRGMWYETIAWKRLLSSAELALLDGYVLGRYAF